MLVLWLALAVVFSIIMGRMYNSNKLFWIMLMSFVTGIAGGALSYRLLSDQSEEDDEDQIVVTMVLPTENKAEIPAPTLLPITTMVTVKPVEKAYSNPLFILPNSSVCESRTKNNSNPRNPLCYTHTSTHRDSQSKRMTPSTLRANSFL